MEFKEINGLRWAMEDLVAEPNGEDVWLIDGHCYFTFDAAQREAAKQGLRVPKASEWMALGESMEMDYDRIREELSLRFSGGRDWSDGTVSNAGSYGYWWSSSPNGAYGFFAYFNSGGGFIAGSSYRSFGFSVRCIKD